MIAPPDTIDCIDCGGPCHRLTPDPELGWQVGDLVTYRCRDCLDRWDLEIDDSDVEPDEV